MITGEISSIHMVKPGRYVAVAQGKLRFPDSYMNMEYLEETLENVFLLQVR